MTELGHLAEYCKFETNLQEIALSMKSAALNSRDIQKSCKNYVVDDMKSPKISKSRPSTVPKGGVHLMVDNVIVVIGDAMIPMTVDS